MPEQQVNPFELQPPPPVRPGTTTITPQGGQEPYAEGSNFQLSPESMQMMWAPQGQGLMPQQPQPQMLIQPPPKINPYA